MKGRSDCCGCCCCCQYNEPIYRPRPQIEARPGDSTKKASQESLYVGVGGACKSRVPALLPRDPRGSSSRNTTTNYRGSTVILALFSVSLLFIFLFRSLSFLCSITRGRARGQDGLLEIQFVSCSLLHPYGTPTSLEKKKALRFRWAEPTRRPSHSNVLDRGPPSKGANERER